MVRLYSIGDRREFPSNGKNCRLLAAVCTAQSSKRGVVRKTLQVMVKKDEYAPSAQRGRRHMPTISNGLLLLGLLLKTNTVSSLGVNCALCVVPALRTARRVPAPPALLLAALALCRVPFAKGRGQRA